MHVQLSIHYQKVAANGVLQSCCTQPNPNEKQQRKEMTICSGWFNEHSVSITTNQSKDWKRNWNSSHSLLVTWWWCAKMLCQQMELMIDVPRENVLGTFTKDRYYNIQGTWGNIQYFTSSFRIVQCYPNIYKYIYLALMLWSSQHNPSEKYPENIFRLTLILFTHLALCLQLKKLRDYSRHILYLYQTLKSSCFQHS